MKFILLITCVFVHALAFSAELPNVTERNFVLPNNASLRGSAAGERSLWVTGSKNSVYLSLDNGLNWQNISPKLSQQYDFRDIEVLSDTTAIIMSAGPAEQSNLFITHDQGKSWQLLYKNKDKTGFFDSIAFFDEQRGVLLGDPVNGSYVIELTNDQGKTWRRLSNKTLPSLLKDEAAFAASGNTLIVQAPNTIVFATGGFSAHVYQSFNNGNSWQRTSVPLFNETATSGAYALYFNPLNQLFVMGGDYKQRGKTYPNLLIQRNKQWSATKNHQTGLRTAMSCIQAFCLSTGKLFTDYSTDFGHHWQPFQQPGYYTLASNQQAIVAAGDNGRVAVFIPNKE